ncbi:acyl-CoA dehydrogenase family protein [Labrenzia sp. PHM005]|uniref:acyl-CoA dehydrogenase family protein n=1 Tax=Labrenzia sp. PHM005 TaxID=2590016 RepID=UPI00113FD2E2|nr:acyl-CoA dehydrogenase family protein [Labrenzia sp. PHM005]QDG78855.1 pimeloyl-CoA dehydrogenase small subunit [Labrenzia sp. PHM005]
MDFELSQEQAMLKDSVDRFVQEKYEFSERKRLSETLLGYSEENWTAFAEMGWLGLIFDEEFGGFDGSPTDMSVIAEGLGAGLALEPLMSTVLLGGALIQALGSSEQKAKILPTIISGEVKLALAYSEPAAGFDLAFHETAARQTDSSYVLNGHKSVVLHAASADRLIVVARTSGNSADRAGLSAFLIDADASGLRQQDYPLVDGGRASDIWFEDVNAELLGTEGDAINALETVINAAICAVCAEAVGAMRQALEISKEYTGTRSQFGRAIGNNQVIQHRLVDMFTAVEEAKAITDITCMRLAGGAENAAASVSAMKAKVGEAGRFVGGQGVQLHGGIGMTDEYPIGHYFKRLMALDVMFGDVNHHQNRFADSI